MQLDSHDEATVRDEDMGKPSQQRIAELLGIAQPTVSLALKDDPRIGKETRERVQAMSRRLKYRPNAHARSLATGASTIVGMASGRLDSPFNASLVDRIAAELAKAGCELMIRTFSGDIEELREQAYGFLDHRAFGVILQGIHPQIYTEIQETMGRTIPVVGIGYTQAGVPCIGCDSREGTRQLTKHLLAMGRRRLAVLVDPVASFYGRPPRTETFVQTAVAAGCLPPTECVVHWIEAARTWRACAYIAVRELLSRHPDIDGIFCNSDEWAQAVIAAAGDMGIRVPEDLAVAGYDGIEEARFGPIPITTVRQPIEAYAEFVVQSLLAQRKLGTAYVPETRVLPGEMIIRRSTDESHGSELEAMYTNRKCI